MKYRVREILLVSSLYDSFVLEEDGRLDEEVIASFLNLQLRFAPRFHRVDSARAALKLMQSQQFDLVITMVRVGRMDVWEFAEQAKQVAPELPFFMLAYDTPELERWLPQLEDSPLDRIFVWQGNSELFLAIIKVCEDMRNVEHDVRNANVRVVLVVEDSPRFYSAFLPRIYTEIMNQVRKLMSDSLNQQQRALRMSARPKILLATNWEQAEDYLNRYQRNLLGLITDAGFHRDGEQDEDAGIKLIQFARKIIPDLPVVLHSAETSNRKQADQLNVAFIDKNAPRMLSRLRDFMVHNMGFGDFVFRLSDGREVGRASDLKELEKLLHDVPPESLLYHGRYNHFSNWLMARGEFVLVDTLRPRKVNEFRDSEELRDYLIQCISRQRELSQRGQIGEYSRTHFNQKLDFSRIGKGSLGGKARGLAFVNALLAQHNLEHKFPDVRIRIPQSFGVSTDVFDQFVLDNNLQDVIQNGLSDAEIIEHFQQGRFSDEFREDMRVFVTEVRYPLAVRSSSLREDSQFQPFAGLYHTYMLANNAPDTEVRLEQLLKAIKLIYASAFFEEAVMYSDATAHRWEEEKMAVILQKLSGRRYGGYFYPVLSGVAQSWNFYPVSYMKPEDGIVLLALGLGRTVVEGGTTVRFAPRYPRLPAGYGSIDEMVSNSQREFFALDMSSGNRQLQVDEVDTLASLQLDVAEADDTLNLVGSVYSAADNRVYDGVHREGTRLVTCAAILKHKQQPLPEILQEILRITERGMGTSVEIEFAYDIDPEGVEKPQFTLLQVRPLVLDDNLIEVEVVAADRQDTLCWSEHVLGNGSYQLDKLLWVELDQFEPENSRSVADDIAALNQKLLDSNEHCLLIGPGRWGSTDPWLGIPVTWPHICQARAIIEVGMPEISSDPSQGSHFFQNLTSMRIGYFTVHPRYPDDWINWKWLRKQPVAASKGCVRLTRLKTPLTVRMDGRSGCGVIEIG